MNLDIKKITDRLLSTAVLLKRYFALIFFLAVAGIISFQLIKIGMLANREPTDDQITSKLSEVKRPRVDQKVVKILKDLESNNIEVRAIFKQARDNPFSE